jgi:L-lactate dehydrogenase complex protein LldG
MRLPAWTGWGYSKDFPRLAVKPFRTRWNGIRQEVREDAEQHSAAAAPAESGTPPGELDSQFIEELTSLGGEVVRVKAQDLPARLEEFLVMKNIDRLCADEAGAGYVRRSGRVCPPDPSLRCGVTGAVCGIADTGSLLLAGAEKDALTPSLLPEMHVVVLKRSQLVASLPEALTLPEARQASAVVVTGPSRTADIEMTLTIGVHGPGEVHVFLIDDS